MSALAANPQLLLNLQGLVNAGHINAEEFAAEKAKLFNAPFEAATPGMLQNALSSICVATQQISATQTELVRHLSGLPYYYPQPSWNYPHPLQSGLLTPSSNSTGSTTGTTKQAPDTVFRPEGQPSLFDLGVIKMTTDPVEAMRQKKKPKIRHVSGKLQCPKCTFACEKQGPLAMHMKHAHPSFSRGSQSVEAMWLKKMTPEQQAEHSRRLLDRARDVMVAFIVKDIVASALAAIVEQDLPSPAWLPKSCDGRKYNKGSQRRKVRSIGFKAKVILDYEMYAKQLGDDMKPQVASIVADIWDLCKHQVNEYMRNKEDILSKHRCLLLCCCCCQLLSLQVQEASRPRPRAKEARHVPESRAESVRPLLGTSQERSPSRASLPSTSHVPRGEKGRS